VHYIQGNAHDKNFVISLIRKYNIDCLVDFMVYTTNEFEERYDDLCSHVKQYIFLSSARVYADCSSNKITEDSPRLLDVSTDKIFLHTDEYPLTKARQENILLKSPYKNYTIIRPYISYNTERLQLGCFEKEQWLYRAIHGRTVIFFKDIASHLTTLTYAYDVALGIAGLIGNEHAMQEIFHITASETIPWGEALAIYRQEFLKVTGKELKVLLLDSSESYYKRMEHGYSYKYDRLYNRTFDNHKILKACNGDISFKTPEAGLSKCFRTFLESNLSFKEINFILEAYMDRITHERTSLSEISDMSMKIKYLIARYTPFFSVLKITTPVQALKSPRGLASCFAGAGYIPQPRFARY